jgi:TonB-dependent starch-binding outer membrane protein SusC
MKKKMNLWCSFFHEHRKIIRTMRISLLLILICSMQMLAGNSYSQSNRLTLNMKNVTIKDVLSQIEEQSGIYFLYDSETIDVHQKVDMIVQDETVDAILTKLFGAGKIKAIIRDRHIILTPIESDLTQQNIKISGRVSDSAGSPLPGVSVVIKGSAKGSITDSEGKYFLSNVPETATLVFSFVGMKTKEIIAAGKTNVDVIMQEESVGLEEVVAIGYGKMSRKDLTSSITNVTSKDLNKGGVYSSPGQLLQGKVPGLTITTSSDPSSSPSVSLRGASTFRTGEAAEPYYVIDGIPGASQALISPDDIESVDVLRDASATAIYGSKAANGVIIITTKKGKSGLTQITYNGYIAIDQVSKRLNLLTGDEHRTFLNDNGLVLSSNDYIGDNTTNTNWQKEVERTGISNNHNVSITGGANKTAYSASVNYMENQGIVKGTQLNRLIARTMVNSSALNDHLSLTLSLNASITNNSTVLSGEDGLSVLDAMAYYLPEAPVYNTDGSFFENLDHSQYYNPVALIKQNQNDTRNKLLQGIAKASLTILPCLSFDANLSYQSETYNNSLYYDIASKAAIGENGYAQRYTLENIHKSMEMYVNFNKTLRDTHKIAAMLGYSWEERNDNDGFETSAQGFTSDALSYYNMGMGTSDILPTYGSIYYTTLRMISFFGRANYSYKGKYMLQATIRRDGSSAFGVNNRWGTFPSGSFAWRLNDEPFIKNLNIFDDLKFRTGYGVSGNSLGFDPYIAMVLYGKSGTFVDSEGNEISAIGATRNANPDLRWERTSMFNVGLDFGFFKNRLTGTIEFYDKRTSDLIADYTVSTTKYLVSSLTANVGKISNKGVELSITAIPVKTKNFSWSTTLNLSHNVNKVESISNDNFSVDYFDEAELNAPSQSGAHQQRILEGKPIGSFYTWKWAGYNDSGVSVFYTADGSTTTTPSDNDRFYTGNAQPKLTVGWNNSLTYKHFSMTMFFTGMFGNKILNGTRAFLSRMGSVTERNILKSAIETNNVNDYNSHYLSDRYIEKGDYLRLSSLSVSYDFKKITDYVHNLRLYASCNNVFVISGYKGMDSEVNLGGITPGIDNRNFYPRTRTFTLGASVTF